MTIRFADSDTEVDDENLFGSGVPSYLVAADNHQIGADRTTIFDPTTWGERATNLFAGTVAAVTRGLTSVYNIAPEVGNWVAGPQTFETADTYDILKNFDDNIATYYDENRKSLDVVGDLLGSVVPGLGGVKVLNWAQKGLTLAAGNKLGMGWNIARSFGTLPTKYAFYGGEAAKELKAAPTVFSYISSNTLKSVAAGYGQSALEFGAFELAASATLRDSPLYDSMDLSDILWNSVTGGGFIGGGIMGSIAAAKTFGAVRQASSRLSVELRPYAATTALEEKAAPSDKILNAILDKNNAPGITAGDELADRKFALLQDRERNLNLFIREEAQKLSGTKDVELATSFTNSLKGATDDTALANLRYLHSIGRVGTTTKTPLEKIFSKAVKTEGAIAPNLALNYLKVSGEEVGTVLREAPQFVNIADTVANSSEVKKFVASKKFTLSDKYDPVLEENHLNAEARQIWARTLKLTDETKIDPFDLPVLKRAYSLGMEARLTDNTIIPKERLLDYIENVVQRTADAAVIGKVPTERTAKVLDVKRAYLEGTVSKDRVSDLFALEDHIKQETQRLGSSEPVLTYLNPSYIKLAYDVKDMHALNGHVLDSVSYIKAMQKQYQTANDAVVANYLGQDYAQLVDRIPDRVMATANNFGPGGGFLSGQNANYGTLGSLTQQIGSFVSRMKMKLTSAVDDSFNHHAYALSNDTKATEDLITITQLMRQTPEKYILKGNELVNIKVAKYEEALEAGGENVPAPKIVDKNAPQRIPLQSEKTIAFVKDWIAHNDTHLTHRQAYFAANGLQMQDLRGTFYIPPPDPKQYKHFAFVVDDSVTSTGHVKMIWADSEDNLARLSAKVDQTNGLTVLFKKDTERFYKAQQQYKYALDINENYIDHALARTGVSAPYFPPTDPAKIMAELMEWRKRTDISNLRDMIHLKYQREFTELKRLGEQYIKIGTSKAEPGVKFYEAKVKDPYTNYVRTALDISQRSEYPIWTPLNNLLETAVSSVMQKLDSAWSNVKTQAEIDNVNAVLAKAGIKFAYEDAATELLANHTAPKPVLTNFVRRANSILSTLMLRTDPLNAVNNMVGQALLGTETRDLVRAIQKGDKEAAGELAELANIKIPGSDHIIPSSKKLIANAYAAWASKVIGRADEGALYNEFKANGWISSLTDQQKTIIDELTLRGTESEGALSKALSKAANTLEKVTFNKSVEEMNRFVAAHIGKQITDIALKHGILGSEQEALSYINTLVNRTQGNYIASQRPLLFQGPIGQAVGLFQTFQFNLMQQLFRYVGEGRNNSAAFLLGLQGTIYGMNGLPAFNFINQHLVGNAHGNVNHNDIVSGVYQTVGREAGDWLLYGVASNMFLHPDLKVNLYTRGDINPRTVTVVPTTIGDVPFVAATGRLVNSLIDTASKVTSGADAATTILQGVEHSGISRPLAGIAQTLEAFTNPEHKSYSTTTKGSIVMANDLMSLVTLGRVIGGRPLDEAVARDAMYRAKSYASARTAEINELGEVIKTKIQSGTLTPDDINSFAREYVERGGKQEQFSRFLSRHLMTAKQSSVNQMVKNINNPTSIYMQRMMGGYTLEDLQ